MKKSAILLLLVITSFYSNLVADQPPNVVMILSDDQSWTDYGFMGHNAIQTPNLDKLAKQSATFRRGYVPTALCRPSLMTLVTGLYSQQNLITGNDPADTRENQKHAADSNKDARELLISNIDKHPTLPRLLAERGYLSFQSGKWWEGGYERGGFTHGMTRGFPKPGGRHGDDGLKIGRDGMNPVNDFIDMATEAKKPFFLWYAPFMPHSPHNPPDRLLKKYAVDGRPEPIAKYFAMCEWFDETCGELMNQLDQKGIADNTLVIYVTDNGWIQNPNDSGYAPRSKRSPYEGGTRTPIMFRWPNAIKPMDRTELCSSIDIVPTILAATGAKSPTTLPGLNLLPNLKSGESIQRDTIFGESYAHDIADIHDPQASLLFRWVIRGNQKLLLTYDGRAGSMKYPPASGEPQLYDLQSDPHEKVNLAEAQPELVRELTGLLNDWYLVNQRKVGVAPKPDGPSSNTTGKKSPKKKGAKKKRSATTDSAATITDSANAESANANSINARVTDSSSTGESSVQAKRPNILFFFTDDQRNTTMGCAGHPIVQTPNVDRLAKEGVRFENMFVSTSTCWVSRACLFTSCYERRHLYRAKPGPLDPNLCATSYFSVLKRAGYRTAHLGKEHVELGDESAEMMFDVRRQLGRNPYFKPQPDGSQRHETQILGDWATEFIREQPADQPFLLQLSFNAPHAEDGDKRPGIGHYPWPKVTDGMYEDQTMPLPRLNAPEIYESQPDFLKESLNRQRFFWRWDTPEKYQTNMRAYLRMLSGIDHVVGRLVEQLEKQGLADNTIIVYSADNGYYLGDRGFAGKWTHYEESLRVPLVVFDPRAPKSDRGHVQSQMVLNSDLGSTMIALAGESVPSTHTGKSLVPLLGGDAPEDWRSDFLCEFLAVPNTIPKWEGVRDKDWVYARYYVDGPDELPFEFLHDLRSDPDQLINLATTPVDQLSEANRAALSKMQTRCDELVAANGPTMREIVSAQGDKPKAKQKARKTKS